MAAGSIPVFLTTGCGVAVNILELESSERWFESSRPDSWLGLLMVRLVDFQSTNRGSIPLRATIYLGGTMTPYDNVAEFLDKNRNPSYNKLLNVILEHYKLNTNWANKALKLSMRYAGMGGEYEILSLFDRIVSLAKEFNNGEETSQ